MTATVGVPVRNGEAFLERTLRALQEQDLADIEVIVADNASVDGTRKIAEAVAEEDPRFSYLPAEANGGIPWNWNRTLAVARAPYFMWNAADDMVRPRHLTACVEALETHHEATIAFSRVLWCDPEDQVVDAMNDEGLDFLSLGPADRVALFFRRGVWQAVGWGGVFRTAALRARGGLPDYWGGDFALGVAMAMRAPWIQVPEVGYVARRHAGQMTNLQGRDPVDQTRAYRPSFRRPVAFPQWYMSARMVAEAARAPAPVAERARAALAVVRHWTVPDARSLGSDVKRSLIRVAGGSFRDATPA